MNKSKNVVQTMCEIGIFAALGYVIDELQGILSKGLFINGGSIGFAFIVVLIVAIRRGWLPGILTGLIIGSLDLLTGAYILHPVQLLLDYVLPYAFVGVAGLLKPLFEKVPYKQQKAWVLVLIAFVGGMLKLLSHYLAGIFFWADPENFAWGLNNMNPYLYCFIYNAAFIGPSIILTGALLVVVLFTAPKILTVTSTELVDKQYKSGTKQIIYLSSIIFAGAIIFTVFLVKYIKSFYVEQYDGALEYGFDQDSMVVFILALGLMILGIISIITVKKNAYREEVALGVLSLIMADSFIYGLARLIRSYVKGKDPKIYWIWFGISLLTLSIALAFFIISMYRSKKGKKELS